MKRLVLIDGKSVFYRGYFAMPGLSLADGTPTGGVYGFAAIAMEIVKKLSPDKVVVAWDSKTSTVRRRAIYSDYKAGRVKQGDDFYVQVPILQELVADLGWYFCEIDEYEADDIIGTLARQADEDLDLDGKCLWETYIISSDLDMLQIVDSNTRMWRIVKGFSEIEEMDVAEVERKYGILKSQFLDLKALKGDSSDNIPGVPGIGEKGAAKLLNTYSTLDGVYSHIDEITGAVQAKLIAGRDSAYMSRQLAQIIFDVPVALSEVPEFRMDRGRVFRGLQRLRFNSLIRKFGLEDGSAGFGATGELEGRSLSPVVTGRASLKPSPVGLGHPQVSPVAPPARASRQGNFSDVSSSPDSHQGDFATLSEILDRELEPVLRRMERVGMLIDLKYFARLKGEFTDRVSEIEQQICSVAGTTFNVNSPIQLSEVLFEKLGLPTQGIKKTKKGFSTGAKELEKLKDLHPIIHLIQEYREASKLLNTYIIPLPELADADGRVHTTFTQDVTATGRLSSVNPNLQNIPTRTEEGRRIRTGFIAPSGRVLVSADYSQFELRLAAVLAGDRALIDDFNSGIDIHTKTAAEAFGVPMEQVTKEQRRAAKVINFGILYGMSAKGLSDATGMTVGEAKDFIARYFELRRPIKDYLDNILEVARQNGYVETFYGRRRMTPDVKAANFLVRAAAERAAANMPIQGTEADLVKKAMIQVDKKLPDGAWMIMQVHDSLIVECDEEDAEAVAQILTREMENVAPELRVRLKVDVTAGKNWGEL